MYNGVLGMASVAASRERGWREECDTLTYENQKKDEIIKQKDEIIAIKDQQIFELQNKVHELESRPTCLGDNVNTKINNTYIYGQDRTDATRSVAGVM